MIYANSFAGSLFKEKDYPVLYRKQAEPSGEITGKEEPLLFQIFSHRKNFSRVEVDVVDGLHSGLGLSGYTSITSPLRKYLDLITQQQFISLLKGAEPVYDRNTLRAVQAVNNPYLARAAAVSRKDEGTGF